MLTIRFPASPLTIYGWVKGHVIIKAGGGDPGNEIIHIRIVTWLLHISVGGGS